MAQHASEVPFNVGDCELISFREGWIVRAAGRSWLAVPTDEKEVLPMGTIKFAIHPDHVHLASGGNGCVERRVKEKGYDLFRVLAGGRVWFVSKAPFEVGIGVSVQPDMKQASFFNRGGRQLSLRVIGIIKAR